MKERRQVGKKRRRKNRKRTNYQLKTSQFMPFI
jgi:hypothetical protein